MVDVTIKEKSRKVILKLQNLNKVSKDSIRLAFFRIGSDLIKTASGHISAKDKTGILYGVVVKNGKKRLVPLRAGLRTHRASAPGQSPANLNGILRRSLRYDIRGIKLLQFSANTPYARRLELGGGSIKKRPYLFRSAKENLRNMEKHFEREIQRALLK
jgi:hypothetical protein